MLMRGLVALGAAALLACSPAHADVVAKAPDGMTIRIVAEAPLDRDAAWARLVDVASWWNDSHTYSGDAKSLSLDAQAGGCWCEAWAGGEVEHGRVVMVMPRQMLRVDGAFGPLQDLGVSAAMTFTLSDGPTAGTTKLTLDYKAVGSSLSGLDQLAPIVDQVLAEQVNSFAAARRP
jgi:hypothetical protein